MMACNFTFVLAVLFICLFFVSFADSKDKKDAKKGKDTGENKKWKKKDVRDYNDADLERLFDQWEDADEDELEEDELPEWKREPPKIDLSQMDPSDPEGMLKMSKKGRTLMLFATVSGNPTQQETEKITQIWQGSLFNANIELQRYVVSDNRVIFMLKDGAVAWEVKDYLIQQDRCEEVTIEGKNYPGKAATKGSKDSKKDKKDKSKEDKKKDKDKKDKSKEDKKKDKEKKDKSKEDTKKKAKTEL